MCISITIGGTLMKRPEKKLDLNHTRIPHVVLKKKILEVIPYKMKAVQLHNSYLTSIGRTPKLYILQLYADTKPHLEELPCARADRTCRQMNLYCRYIMMMTMMKLISKRIFA